MGTITKKLASVALSTATVAWISGFAMLVPVANAQSVSDLQAQINALLQQITALQAQLAAQTGAAPAATSCNFTRNLTVGVVGEDVKCLQQYLNGAGYKVAASGVGSPGSETTYFGSLTQAAVGKWQAANGVSPAAGYFGSISRAKYASLVAAAPAPTTPPTTVPSGTGLTARLASDQPQNGLFGESFASRPFTKLQFTASADGDVTVKALLVERTGQGSDAAFSGVVALDEDGLRLGPAKTFGSDHRLRLTEKFVVKAGQTRTITLGGDSDADQNDYNGQLVALSLVGVETEGSVAVNASYPLTGATHTVNSTLAIGTLTLAKGSFDPGSGLTKEIGTTGYIFSGLRLTAGSNEDVLVKAIQWNQSGSAGTADIANVKVVLDGTTYDTTVSSDGKYYTAKFGSGIKIEKGLNKELYVKGDVADGSARTIDFDLYRYADLQVLGLTYGYTLLPSATETTADNDDDSEFQDAEPRYDGSQVQIAAGTITVQNAPSVGSQNIAINLPNQPLGGMIVDVKGEDITVAAINFDLSVLNDAGTAADSIDTNDVTNITLVREDGTVVAGPVDGVAGANNAVRFTDTVTFKPGRTVYTLKGKIGTDIGTSDTVAASTTPSSDWTTVRGVTSGVTISPTPTSAVTMSTMTVKAAALTVSLTADTQQTSDASSTAQNVVAGTPGYAFTQYVLDASGSGEDIRLNAMQLRLTFSAVNTADDITNCQLYDGNTVLNSGSNIVNPSNSDSTAANKTFTLDSSLIVPKGTVKTLTVKCNLISGADTGQQWQWGITDQDASITATGVTSGQSVDGSDSITATENGRVITARTSGALSVTEDPVTALKWIQAGSTDNTLLSLRFNATDENVRIDTIGLQLATTTAGANFPSNASNSPSDVSKVTLWVGSTKVGEAVFTSSDYATATLTGVTVPKDGQTVLTVKGDVGAIGTGLATRPGHLLVVNYDADSSSDETNLGAVGVGLSSGVTVGSGGSDSAANGARISKVVPTVAKLTLPTNTFSQNESSKSLYRFKISAPSGTNGVSLYKFTFNIATSSKDVNELPADGSGAQTADGVATDFSNDFAVTNLQVKCYSDASFSTAACGNTSGLLNQFDLAIANNASGNIDFGSTSVGTSYAASSDGDANGDGLVVAGSPAVDAVVLFNPTATSGGTPERVGIPAGSTYYFELLGDIANATTTASISVRMQGDATFSAGYADNSAAGSAQDDITADGDNWSTGRYLFATAAGAVHEWDDNQFIWSGNSTNTSQSVADYDWFNGFLVPGLSNTDTGTAETLSKS